MTLGEELTRLREEVKDMPEVRYTDIWPPGWEQENDLSMAPTRLMVGFEREATEIPRRIRIWLRANDLIIMNAGRLEEDDELYVTLQRMEEAEETYEITKKSD